jgi:hypothetical protein
MLIESVRAANEWRPVATAWHLGVALDWPSLLASFVLTAVHVRVGSGWRSIRPDAGERLRPLPGDELIGDPLATWTHAITIHGGPKAVWPWLVQMGAGNRAGWYSYDAFDNGRRPSATRIVPELQKVTVGTVFPAAPGIADNFKLLGFSPGHWLLLGSTTSTGEPTVTWVFVLEERPDRSTRLIVRVRGSRRYSFRGLPPRISKLAVRLVHYVMERKQLAGVITMHDLLRANVV